MPDNHLTTYGSVVELVCISPLYNPYPNSSVMCQGSGEWSIQESNITCLACNQSPEALNITNGYLVIHKEAGASFGYTGTVECETDHILFGNGTASCEANQGVPTWRTVSDDLHCVRNYWNQPEPVGLENKKFMSY